MNINTFMDTNTDEDKDKDEDMDNVYGLGREKVLIQIKKDSYKLWQRGA
jgi:hypothetical protein